MLQSIRDRAHGLVAGVIVFFICMTFALWGIQSYVDSGRRVIVAEVNSDEIELREFQQSYQRFRQQAQALLGESFDPKDWQEAEVRQAALDKLIEERVLSQLADKAGFRITDPQVQTQLRQFPAFQQDGAFSKAVYQQRVRQMNFSEIGFEQRMRLDMAIQQLQSGIAGSEFVTADEARQLERIRDQKRDIGYATVSSDPFKDEVELSDEDIQAYYGRHEVDFVTEEKVSLEYIELSTAALMDDVMVDEPKLQAYYEEHEADYTAEEERSANHILIQIPAGASPEEADAAREKALSLKELAAGGTDFEQIAMENSDDVGSRAEGGATGFFGRGVMAPEFEQAVFEMSAGEISEPIKTQFGYHIIQLNEIKEGGLKPFAEVREDVEQAFRREQAEQLYFDQAEQFSNLIYEHPDSLAVAAEALGLEVSATDSLTAAELSGQFVPVAATAAFSEEVLVQGLNSEPLESDDGRIFAIRVAEHSPSRTLTLEEVREGIVRDLTNDRSRELARELGEALIERLEAGEDAESVIGAAGLEWKVAEQVDRSSAKVSRAIIRAAFKSAAPDDGKSAFSGVPIGTGDYGVIRVSNIRIPAVEELATSDINDLKKEIEQSRMAAGWRSFVLAVKDLADIQTFPQNL